MSRHLVVVHALPAHHLRHLLRRQVSFSSLTLECCRRPTNSRACATGDMNAQCGNVSTVLVYVGSDLDLSVVNHLRCGERTLVYVDPLTFWRNSEAIERALRSSARGAALDDLFECKACVRPVQDGDARKIARHLVHGLPRVPFFRPAPSRSELRCRMDSMSSALLSRFQYGRSGQHVRVHNWSNRKLREFSSSGAPMPAIEVWFESRNTESFVEHRRLQFFVESGEDLDWKAVLHGKLVSTVVWVGAVATHVEPLLCRLRRTQPGSLVRTIADPPESRIGGGGSEMKLCGIQARPSSWRKLGCYCSHTNRASAPCLAEAVVRIPPSTHTARA